MLLGLTAAATSTILTAALAVIGAAAGIYSTRQGILAGRRTADAESAANSLRERTVDREDFESVVDGLRGVLAERTAQYNELLAEHRADRERIVELERENRRLQGGAS